MGITADRLRELELVDDIVPEPLGGAHRDIDAMASRLKQALVGTLELLEKTPLDELLRARYARLMQYGKFEEV